MSDEMTKDFEWLKELHKKSWKHHPPEWSGGRQRSYGHNEDLEVSKEDGKKSLKLFDKYRDKIAFEPGSGVWGFGVSITAYYVDWATYPGVPTEPVHLITLTSKQLFPGDRRQEQTNAYKLFESFTHTDKNKELRKACGLKENLKDYSYYDY